MGTRCARRPTPQLAQGSERGPDLGREQLRLLPGHDVASYFMAAVQARRSNQTEPIARVISPVLAKEAWQCGPAQRNVFNHWRGRYPVACLRAVAGSDSIYSHHSQRIEVCAKC